MYFQSILARDLKFTQEQFMKFLADGTIRSSIGSGDAMTMLLVAF